MMPVLKDDRVLMEFLLNKGTVQIQYSERRFIRDTFSIHG